MALYMFDFTGLESEDFGFDSREEAIQAARDWVRSNASAWDSGSGLLTVEEEIEEDDERDPSRAIVLVEHYVRDASGVARAI